MIIIEMGKRREVRKRKEKRERENEKKNCYKQMREQR